MYAYRCNICGAYLDPGEHCDCESNNKLEYKDFEQQVKKIILEKNGQMAFDFGRREI